MPYLLRLDKIRFIVLFLFFLQTTFLVGQDYRINNVLPYLKNDSIKIDLSVQNLFEGEIRKTLLTGIKQKSLFSGEFDDENTKSPEPTPPSQKPKKKQPKKDIKLTDFM